MAYRYENNHPAGVEEWPNYYEETVELDGDDLANLGWVLLLAEQAIRHGLQLEHEEDEPPPLINHSVLGEWLRETFGSVEAEPVPYLGVSGSITLNQEETDIFGRERWSLPTIRVRRGEARAALNAVQGELRRHLAPTRTDHTGVCSLYIGATANLSDRLRSHRSRRTTPFRMIPLYESHDVRQAGKMERGLILWLQRHRGCLAADLGWRRIRIQNRSRGREGLRPGYAGYWVYALVS